MIKREPNKKVIAVMGGTFDPIHFGHLCAAEEAAKYLRAERVIFIPSGNPPHKNAPAANAEHRYAMTILATADNPDFFVSRMEIEADGYSYTIDTAKKLTEEYPDASIVFIIGTDSANQIATWHRAKELLEDYSFLAVSRPGVETSEKPAAESGTDFLEILGVNVSSSEIRERLHKNESAKYLLPDTVLGYISKHGLYRDFDFAALDARLKNSLTEKRYRHTQGVIREASALAQIHGADAYSAKIAAALHDVARCMPNGELFAKCKEFGIDVSPVQNVPVLLHAPLAAKIAETEYGVTDADILAAIEFHTTGRKKMSLLEKIIYVADMTEPYRENFRGLDEIRRLAYTDIDRATISALKLSISFTEGKGEVAKDSLEALKFLTNSRGKHGKRRK
ncbi:hypothetical protein FACS189490_01960 [Clostridia bacterium]|nr:hypothetical protein FACS189490_01960 [Clostridia bacterium]